MELSERERIVLRKALDAYARSSLGMGRIWGDKPHRMEPPTVSLLSGEREIARDLSLRLT